jgi:pSer/pThr/pTyr-binding forkhead associated (FHA) protein
MEPQFWTVVDRYTDARWWFGMPAVLIGAATLFMVLLAMMRLHKYSLANILLTSLALSSALALALPGALLAWRPLMALGLDGADLTRLPTTGFLSVAQVFDRALQMNYVGAGLLLVGSLGALGMFGARRGSPCPNCGRERHPDWKGVCPECRLMTPGVAESPLMRLGDRSASGLPVTQFGVPAQTALLDQGAGETAWVEIVEASVGEGERFAVGARLTIGRDPNQCQMVLDDETVSARHAYIERDPQGFVLYDWGSRNGTRVNDEAVASRRLRDGDLLQLGRTRLRFAAPETADDTATMLLDSGQANAQLVALDEPLAGCVFTISRLDVHIGRSKQNDIVIDMPSISRRHASIHFDGLDYHLVDAGASNGTWLDEVRVQGDVRLTSGQIIRLGAQRLRFERKEVPNASRN